MSVNRLTGEQFKSYVYNHLPEYYREQDDTLGKPLYKFLCSLDDSFDLTIKDANGILDIIDPEKTPTYVLPYLFKSYGLEIFNGLPESYSRSLLSIIGVLWKYKGTSTAIHYLTSLISGVTTKVVQDNVNLTVTLEMDYESDIGDSRLPSRENLVRIIDEFIPFYCIAVIIYSYHFSEDQKVRLLEDFDYTHIAESLESGATITLDDMDGVDNLRINISALETVQSITSKVSDSMTNKVYNLTNSSFILNQEVSGFDVIRTNGKTSPDYVFNVE